MNLNLKQKQTDRHRKKMYGYQRGEINQEYGIQVTMYRIDLL